MVGASSEPNSGRTVAGCPLANPCQSDILTWFLGWNRMQFDRLKRDGFPAFLGGVAPPAGPLGKRAQQSLSDSGARTPDRPIHVLILIPTLNVGGAEMDLLRTMHV
jgi:hypothetical protein